MKIIVRNKRDRQFKQELSLEEFKKTYSSELKTAIKIYSQDEQRKDMIKPPFSSISKNYEDDFYNDLRWNFNNKTNSNYYIEIH